jgi:hypothetical protein
VPNVARANLAALAGAAALTLLAGLLFRSSLEERSAPAPAAPPSEASALRQLSQESQLRRLARYLSDRGAELATFVEYRPELGASSVRLRDSTYLSTAPATPALLTRGTVGDSLGAPLAAPDDSTDHGWVLVVGRRADGEVISLSGLAGGRLTTSCGGREASEIALGVPLYDALAGAGVFSVDGRLLGVVARCPERLLALTVGAATRLLAADSVARDSTARDSTTTRDSTVRDTTTR